MGCKHEISHNARHVTIKLKEIAKGARLRSEGFPLVLTRPTTNPKMCEGKAEGFEGLSVAENLFGS